MEKDRLPVSDSIKKRPVWERRQRRIYMQDQLEPPTDEEKHDAILVLADPSYERDAPAVWQEATRIFLEASDPVS